MSRFSFILSLMVLEGLAASPAGGSPTSLDFPSLHEPPSPRGIAVAPIKTESREWQSLNSTKEMGRNGRLRSYPKQTPLLLLLATSAVSSALIFLVVACYRSLMGSRLSNDHGRRLSGNSDDCSSPARKRRSKRAAEARRSKRAAAPLDFDSTLDAVLLAVLDDMKTGHVHIHKGAIEDITIDGWSVDNIRALNGHINQFTYTDNYDRYWGSFGRIDIHVDHNAPIEFPRHRDTDWARARLREQPTLENGLKETLKAALKKFGAKDIFVDGNGRISLVKGVKDLTAEQIRDFLAGNNMKKLNFESSIKSVVISVKDANKDNFHTLAMAGKVERLTGEIEELQEMLGMEAFRNITRDEANLTELKRIIGESLQSQISEITQRARNDQGQLQRQLGMERQDISQIQNRIGQLERQQNAAVATASIALGAVALGLVLWAWKKLGSVRRWEKHEPAQRIYKDEPHDLLSE